MKRRFYLVRPERFLHFPNFPSQHRVWAKPGEYVEATHPLLLQWISGQLGKVQSVNVIPRGSIFIDESKLPRGVTQMMSQHDKGRTGGVKLTTEEIHAETDDLTPAPLSALGDSEPETAGTTSSPEEGQEGAQETASATAGDPGGIPDVQPPE